MDVTGFLPRQHFNALLTALTGDGYRCIGPQLRDGAIVYSEIASADALPAGVLLQSRPGAVTATQTQLPRLFAWANGPQALKPLLFSPREVLWRVERDSGGRLGFTPEMPAPRPTAVIGVRSCDLAALDLQDRHFLHGEYRDAQYAVRREALLLIAVNCSHPAETCFCVATGDGPNAGGGYDVLLDELDSGFILRAGSRAGERLMARLALSPVRADQWQKADATRQAAVEAQQRSIPAGNLHDALSERRGHERWDAVAERCLSCGNCTQVCPTCFCNREHDEPDLNGAASAHLREWDSCFTEGHSYIHGLVVRKDVAHRYRQWLTHKLGGWHPQYGRSGCVGCGRCIAWCPVGIDLCEEVNAVMGGGDDG